jgi:hypothetical protein
VMRRCALVVDAGEPTYVQIGNTTLTWEEYVEFRDRIDDMAMMLLEGEDGAGE